MTSTIQRYRDAGFDKTVRVGVKRYYIQCSQCEALVINNTAVHERGCPNALAVLAVDEPQHGSAFLFAVYEYGREWVTCTKCGRQWAVEGSTVDIIAEGDSYCDDKAGMNDDEY